jgi:ParB family transcriptional regulator, chromosome partitioning protein
MTTAEKVTTAETTAVAEKPATENRVPLPDKRKALGRGLESLLPGGPRVVPGAGVQAAAAPAAHASSSTAHPSATHAPSSAAIADIQSAARRVEGHTVLEIPVEQVHPNPYQTRSQITRESLEELAESIRANGVIQPITVRPAKEGKYVLITGERRTQASKLAGKQTIPAIVRHVSDQQAAEMTIIENVQRRDLNCLDQAEGFARLSRDFGLTQEEIGKRTGCDRSSVSNYMRLLKLPGEVQSMLRAGELDFSQARVLLTVQDGAQLIKFAEQARSKHLSVDQLETLVMNANYPASPADGSAGGARWVDPNVKAAQRELETILGVRVKIRDRKGKGKIVIEYATLEDFDRVLEMLKGKSH